MTRATRDGANTQTGTVALASPHARALTECGLCGGTQLERVLSLGASPPPCVMHPVGERPVVEERYPLELVRCEDCTLVQLSVIVDPRVLFPPEFPYSSGNSKQLHRNFEDLAAEVVETIGPLSRSDLVVDIGANDGTLLSKFGGCQTVGIDPTDQVQRIKGDYVQAFFNELVAEQIVELWGQARVITACNVLAHVNDLGSVMRGIKTLLAPDGILIAENHDLRSVLEGQWDMAYHEHLRFYSPSTFRKLLNRYDLGNAGWRSIGTHGGSFRMIATHGDHGVGRIAEDNTTGLQHLASTARRELWEAVLQNGPVVGIGAAARATTIINYCGFDVEDIECVVEVPGSDKIGRYIPGTQIPVVEESHLLESDRMAVLFSWHLEDLIVPKLREQGFSRPVLVPIPEVHYVW